MPRSKFRYNPETLNYEKIKYSFEQKLIRFAVRSGGSLLAAAIVIFGLSFLIDLPKDRVLKNENQHLKEQLKTFDYKLNIIEGVLSNLQERDDNLYRTIFSADPIPEGIRKAGFGGVNKYSNLTGFESSEVVVRTARKLDIILKQIDIQSKSYDDVLSLAKENEIMLEHIPRIFPVKVAGRVHIGSPFLRSRLSPIYGYWMPHEGQDFNGPIGTPVFATGDGVVKNIKVRPYSKVDFGTVIYIDHGYGYETIYGHLNKVLVKKGQKIKRGQQIAEMGNTGGSVGPHLHYEVHLNGIPRNPINFFFGQTTPEEFDRIIAMSRKRIEALD